MAIKTHKVTLSLDNPRVIQSGINVQSFDKQSIQISIELTKNDEVFQVPSDATIRVSLLKLARQEQKIIVDVPNTNRDSIDWIVPDYLDGYQGTVRVGVYLVSGAENVDLGYFTILSNVSDIDKMADEFTDNVFQGWEQIEADLNELNLTIAQTKLDLADDLTQIDTTIANINAKNAQVDTLASNFTADVATKQADVTSKYNAFDTSVTQAGQTIDDILALQPQFQSVLDETTGKDVISAPEIILARDGAETLGERLEEDKAEVTAQLAQIPNQTYITEKAKTEYVNSELNLKADKIYTDEQLGLKRDKAVKITSSDLDTSSDIRKIRLLNLSEEVQNAMAGTAPVISSVANGSLTKEKYADDSVTHNKRTALGRTASVGYYQKAIDFNVNDGIVTIPSGTRLRSGYYTKYFSEDFTLTTGDLGYYLLWNTKTNEIRNVMFLSSNSAYTENDVIIAVVAYPKNADLIKVEGLENYTINGKKPLITSTQQAFLGKTAHIITGYGRRFNLDTETRQFYIPKDTVFMNGKYSYRLNEDINLNIPDGYSLVYLDTSDNTFIRVAHNASSSAYREDYLLVCTIGFNTTYKSWTNVQGIDNCTIDGKMGNLSDYKNNIMKNSIEHPLFTPKKRRFIGHRGLSGLQPENTLPAFEECGIKGIFGVETDIRKTSDGHFVCIHDSTVDRTTDGTGNVSDMTLDQIKNLTIDGGTNIENHTDLKVPTLEEMLLSCSKYGLVPMLHLYTEVGDEPAIVDIVNRLGFENSVIYTSNSPRMLGNIADLCKSLVFDLGGATADLSTIPEPYASNQAGHYDYNAYNNYPNAIKDIHKNRMIASVWVINDSQVAEQFFMNGIDVIATDILY